MNSLNKIELKYIFTLPSILFFGLFLSTSVVAQSHKDKNMPDVPKSADVVNFDTSDASFVDSRDAISSKPAPAQIRNTTSTTPTAAKKENPLFKQGSDKDQVKKENKSTLSFNMFLYIVDKFRED